MPKMSDTKKSELKKDDLIVMGGAGGFIAGADYCLVGNRFSDRIKGNPFEL